MKKDDQIFGVPLQDSLRCARAAIAYVDNDVQYVGFIPVIVAKCGSFLKDQGKTHATNLFLNLFTKRIFY